MPQHALGSMITTTILDGPNIVEALETFAVPSRTHSTTLSVHIESEGDPGAFEFAVEVSNDGENFFPLETIVNAADTNESVGINIPDFGFAFVKVSQYTKDNDVVTNVHMRLA